MESPNISKTVNPSTIDETTSTSLVLLLSQLLLISIPLVYGLYLYAGLPEEEEDGNNRGQKNEDQ